MNAVYMVLVVLCLIGLVIRSGYELLKNAGRVDTKTKIVFAVVFVGMCLMLMSWPFLGLLAPSQRISPIAIRWIGLFVSAAGICLAVGGLFQLKGLENIDHLVTSGLYTKLRHPMYTGFILWIVGWVIYNVTLVNSILGLLCILNILYWRMLEEKKLEAQFGDEYRRYERRTYF